VASESPYDRLGESTGGERLRRRRAISDALTIFRLAHEGLGEWRDWRDVAELGGVDDPMDLRGMAHPPTLSATLDVELAAGQGASTEDLSADLGQTIGLEWATPELQGKGELLVTDTGEANFALALRAPGDDAIGDKVDVSLADFRDVDGEPVVQRALLMSASGRYAVDVELTLDMWLVLWLARCVDVAFVPEPTRDELEIPGPVLE